MTRTWIGWTALLLAAAAGPAPAWAGGEVERTELRRAPLEGQPGTVVVMTELTAPPGARVPRHTHPGDELVYVLQAGRIQAPGEAPRELAAGSTLRFPRGQVHGGFEVVGDGPVKVLTVHVVDSDEPMTRLAD